MKILLLTLYFDPDVAANAVIMTELAEELVKHGHQITVVTSFPHYAGNKVQDRYQGRLFCKEERPGMTIIRTTLFTSPKKSRFLVRLLNYLSFNLMSTAAGVFSGPQDLIFAPSPPLTIGLSAAMIGFLKGIPYVYNVQDINPDVLIKLDILKNPALIAYSKWLEKFVYRRALHITVLSQSFKENLMRKGVESDKISVLPNFIDPEFIRPQPRDNQLRRDWGLQGQFVILYAGNLGHSQDIESLIEAADRLKDREELTFVVVGNGSRKPQLVEKVRALDLPNLTFQPFQSRERVPEIYAAADLCMVALRKGIALDSVPSKMYSIFASGRPLLASVDPGSEAWNLIEDGECGVCVEPENPSELTRAILDLYGDPAARERFGNKARAFVLQRYTREMVGERYHRLFTMLVPEPARE